MREALVKAEEFKDSPVGRIPKDWEVKTLGQILSSIDAGKSPNCPDKPAQAGEWGVLKVSAVHPQGLKAEENKAITNPVHINAAYEVKDGDLLISRANTYELVGRTCLVQNPPTRLLLSDKTLRLNVDTSSASSEFIACLMQMPFVRSQIEINATGSSGSMKNISQETIKRILIPLPGINEQKCIVSLFQTVDTAIAHTSSLIAKLKQMKAGLLHHLLTRGLDENGELRDAIAHPQQFKDSPLGQIPKDWLVVSVGECLARIEQGWSPDCESNSTPIGEWGVLKTTAVVWEGYQDFENKQLPSQLQPDPNYEVYPRYSRYPHPHRRSLPR